MQNAGNPNAGECVEPPEFPYIAGGMQSGTVTLEDSVSVSYKITHFLPYNPAITLCGIYPKELKTVVHIKTSTQMFIATFFLIGKMLPFGK